MSNQKNIQNIKNIKKIENILYDKSTKVYCNN